MDDKKYKASTNEKFRQVLKLFYKTVYGNHGESYPDCVKWFSVKLSKEKTGKETSMDMSEYLEEDEIKKLIEYAPTLQKRAFLACLYESGARPEEFLRITNRDIRIDKNGVILMLRGKTGERRVRIVTFSKLLQQWLDVHPLKDNSNYPLWVSEATNFKNNALGIRGAEKIIEDILPKTGLSNKHARLYILRHSRATHLARHFTEAQMCTFFGWVQGTQVVRRYIHLSGKDLDDKLLALNERIENVKPEEYKLKPIKCQRCSETISSIGSSFCMKCGLSVKIADQYIQETDIERENKELKLQLRLVMDEISSVKDQMREMFTIVNNMSQETKNQFAKEMVSKKIFK
jgi:integrase/recombinase XerD